MEPINGNFCAPAPIKFQATFSETPESYFWQFGEVGKESGLPSPTFIYSVPGSYTVTLTVLFPSSIKEFKKVVTVVGSPNFILIPSKTYACAPGAVEFQISGNSNLTELVWDFGDNTTANSNSSTPISHTFSQFGNFVVSLTAKNQNGCSGKSATNVLIRKPTAILYDSIKIGCLPVSVFFGVDVSVPAGTSVSNYIWDFGDGSPIITTTTDSIQHSYTTVNSFSPKLSIITSEGCTNTYNYKKIITGDPPGAAEISINSKDTICASELASFSATSTGANYFVWNIGNIRQITTTNGQLDYKFSVLGNFKVKVTPFNNGCPGKADSMNILVRGLIAVFRASNECKDKSTFNFRNISNGVLENFKWFFNSTTVGATTRNAIHKFPPSGAFPVSLIVSQNTTGCADTVTNIVYTAQPKLLGSDTFVCKGQSVSMIINDSYAIPGIRYDWYLAGKELKDKTSSSISDVANEMGEFKNRVIIRVNSRYCNDTLYQTTPMRVSSPNAAIHLDSNICLDDSLQLVSLSQPYYPDLPIDKWFWDFGNGSTSNLETPPPFRYSSPGFYEIKLNVIDSKGCADSTANAVVVRRLPILRVVSPKEKVCQGEDVVIEAIHNASLFWNPSNLFNCDTCSSVTVKPMQPTIYEVVAIDTFGCKITQPFSLDVWEDYVLNPNLIRDTGICVGNSVQFDLQLNDKIINWSPSSGLSGNNIVNPLATPLVTTTYTATITDSTGCFAKTLSAVVEVNPLPEIVMGRDLYMQFNTPFTIRPTYSSDIVSYNWQPAGLLSCSNCPEPSGIALGTNIFTVITTTSKGCIDSASIIVSIECTEDNIMMPNAFTPNNDGLNDFYYPITKGKPRITRFIIYNRMGEVVFQRYNFEPNERALGWDGTYKGKHQPSGSFVYIVETECYQGASTSKRGNLLLLR